MTRPQSLVSIGDRSVPRFANMVLYSYPGVGKTVIWGTGGPRLMIMDSDNGVESAEASGSEALSMPVLDYDQLGEAYEWVKHEAIPQGILDWVVWDSVTLFQDRALIDDVLKDAAAANPKQDPHVASQREYLINQNRILEYVRMFCDLPINFGISAHVLPDVDPEGEIILMPDVRGKNMPSKLSGYMNIVAYLAVDEEGKRRIITESKSGYYGKDRFHALRTNGKGFLDKPTIPKIDALLAAKRDEVAAKKAGRTAPATTRRRRKPAAKST